MKKRILAAGENYLKGRKFLEQKKNLTTGENSQAHRNWEGGGWGAATLHPPTPLPDINAKIYLLPIDNYSIIVKGKKVKNNAKYFKFLENYW